MGGQLEPINVISSPVVAELLRDGTPEQRARLQSLPRFPDGAVQVADAGGWVHEVMVDFATRRGRAFGASVFRSLAPYERRFYNVHYSGEYARSLGEMGLIVMPGTATPVVQGEAELARLPVYVEFRGRASRPARESLADGVLQWARTVAGGGVFGGGPVPAVSEEIRFSRVGASFWIDASRTNQDTINWLTLNLLDFGCRIAPIYLIEYGGRYGLATSARGKAETHVASVPLTGGDATQSPPAPADHSHADSPAAAAAAAPAAAAAAVPTHAHPTLRSNLFEVLQTDRDEWDSLSVTIVLALEPSAVDLAPLERAIASWLTLAEYGGFGGAGIHGHLPVQVDEANHRLHVYADMGDADPRIALPQLVRVLENVHLGGTPITQVIFGRLDLAGAGDG